jgi:hypothetical protein
VSGSRAGFASLARGTGYRGNYGEQFGTCSKCGEGIHRLAWQDYWMHDGDGKPTCDPLKIRTKGDSR